MSCPWLPRRLSAGVAGAAIGFSAVAAIRPIRDPDLFWHIRTGELIATRGEIPAVDVFSHTYAGRPLHLVDWLCDLLLYWVHSAGGLAGIEALSATLAFAIMTVAAARFWRRETPAVVAAAGLPLIYAGAAAWIYARPQTFGMLLCTFEVLLLERALSASGASRRRWLLWCLPPLLCLWSNLHGSSPLGLALLAVFAVGDLVEQRGIGGRALLRLAGNWLLLVCASVACLLIASNPIGRLDIGFMLSTSSFFHSAITEWKPTGWQILLSPIGPFGVVLLVGLVLDRRAVQAWEWLLFAFSVGFASTVSRFVPFFTLLAGPVGLRHLSDILRRRFDVARATWRIADGVVAVVLVGAACVTAFVGNYPMAILGGAMRPVGGLAAGIFPEGAVRFLAHARPVGPVFNSYHWGGYLMWAFPDLPVFIDGRTETLYDEAFLKENTDFSPETWRGLFAKYAVTWAIIVPCAVEEAIASQPDWAVVYFDDDSSILVRRTSSNAALVDRLGYRFLTPEGLRKGSQPKHAPDMLAEAGRAVAAAPSSGRAHLALANALLVMGDDAGYQREAAQAQKLSPYVGRIWFRIGVVHLLTKQPGARGELARAVELAPYSAQFRETLALACLVEHDPAAAARAITPLLRKGEPAATRLAQLSGSGLGKRLGIGTSAASMVPSPGSAAGR